MRQHGELGIHYIVKLLLLLGRAHQSLGLVVVEEGGRTMTTMLHACMVTVTVTVTGTVMDILMGKMMLYDDGGDSDDCGSSSNHNHNEDGSGGNNGEGKTKHDSNGDNHDGDSTKKSRGRVTVCSHT